MKEERELEKDVRAEGCGERGSDLGKKGLQSSCKSKSSETCRLASKGSENEKSWPCPKPSCSPTPPEKYELLLLE